MSLTQYDITVVKTHRCIVQHIAPNAVAQAPQPLLPRCMSVCASLHPTHADKEKPTVSDGLLTTNCAISRLRYAFLARPFLRRSLRSFENFVIVSCNFASA